MPYAMRLSYVMAAKSGVRSALRKKSDGSQLSGIVAGSGSTGKGSGTHAGTSAAEAGRVGAQAGMSAASAGEVGEQAGMSTASAGEVGAQAVAIEWPVSRR